MLVTKFTSVTTALAFLIAQGGHAFTWTEQGYSPALTHELTARAPAVGSHCIYRKEAVYAKYPYASVELFLYMSEGWESTCDRMEIRMAIQNSCYIVHGPGGSANQVPFSGADVIRQTHGVGKVCWVRVATVSDPMCVIQALCELEHHGTVPKTCRNVRFLHVLPIATGI